MDSKQRQQTIHEAQRIARSMKRRLAEEDSFSSAHYRVVRDIERMLQEQLDLLIQLQEDLSSEHSGGQDRYHEQKRGRGGIHQNYLLDNNIRASYIQHIREILQRCYNSQTRCFALPDGTIVRASLFLACLYEVGIWHGLASESAPVKDFAEIVRESADGIPNFTTAYNTIQSVTRVWRSYVGNRGYVDRTIHLYSLDIDDVVEGMRVDYAQSREVLSKIGELAKMK